MSEKNIIGNCPLCEQHSLHVNNQRNEDVQQCISCGYVTSERYNGTKEDNEVFKQLTSDMKGWAVEKNNAIWIPSIITLPNGMIYPDNKKESASKEPELEWLFAPMVDIPEDEQKNFPNEQGGFYQKKVDTDNAKKYNTFFECLTYVNNLVKTEQQKPQEIKLPKLKKVK
jgi:Zn ribbon nucleic-acid-binding protein